MSNLATKEEVSSFLEKAKDLLCRGSFLFVSRRKNLQSLAEFGLTIFDAKEEIWDLRTKDYYKGPKKDFDKPGYIWEFKKVIHKKKFYIKLKISEENGKEVLKCLGFHKDDFAQSLRGGEV